MPLNQYPVIICWKTIDSEEDIESFSKINEALLVRFPFTKDHPPNETNINWDLFRLSKVTMKDISSRSIFWRGTCSIISRLRVDFRDYIRVRVSVLDLTQYLLEASRTIANPAFRFIFLTLEEL